MLFLRLAVASRSIDKVLGNFYLISPENEMPSRLTEITFKVPYPFLEMERKSSYRVLVSLVLMVISHPPRLAILEV